MESTGPLTDEELLALYTWVDVIPLSRPKQKISRDFADGVLMAEICKYYFPKLVELHNYSSANSMQQKVYNWETLSQKVFKKIKFNFSKHDAEQIVNAVPGAIERVLYNFKQKVQSMKESPSDFTSSGPGSATRASAPSGPGSASRRLPDPEPVPQVVPHQPHTRPGFDRAGPRQTREAKDVDTELLVEKEQTIRELRETVEILEQKILRLKELVNLKEAKNQQLAAKLQAAGLL